MQRILLLFWLLLVLSIGSNTFGYTLTDTISLFDAKAHGKLTFIARGAYNPNKTQPELRSSHYGECIDVRIKNNSATQLAVKLEAGTLLISTVNHAQNMLVTKTMYYILEPNQKYNGRVYAMCGELKKKSPRYLCNL